jgi:hypothetical protein
MLGHIVQSMIGNYNRRIFGQKQGGSGDYPPTTVPVIDKHRGGGGTHKKLS